MDAESSDAKNPRREVVDLEAELVYWRFHWHGLVDERGLLFSDFEPAVKLGMNAYVDGKGRDLLDMAGVLEASYQRVRGESRLEWGEAYIVVRAVWKRLCRPIGG